METIFIGLLVAAAGGFWLGKLDSTLAPPNPTRKKSREA